MIEFKKDEEGWVYFDKDGYGRVYCITDDGIDIGMLRLTEAKLSAADEEAAWAKFHESTPPDGQEETMIEFKKAENKNVLRLDRNACRVCIDSEGKICSGMIGLSEEECAAAWAKFRAPCRPVLPKGWEWESRASSPIAFHADFGYIYADGTSDVNIYYLDNGEIDAFFEARCIVTEEAKRRGNG